MMGRILLIDDNQDSVGQIRGGLSRMGHEVVESSGADAGYAIARRISPDAVVLNMDLADGRSRDLCQKLHTGKKTADIPVVALSSSCNMGEVEKIFSLGARACFSRPINIKHLVKKIDELLAGELPEEGGDSLDAPPELRAVFTNALQTNGGRLGDMAEVFHGVSVRDHTFRRMAPPADNWWPVITEDLIAPFTVAPSETYVRFDRVGLLRVPDRDEYNLPQKVVLSRTAPPVAAALDRSRMPVSAGVYSIVPARGLEPAYLTCLLGSRLMDFYFNRIRPLGSNPGGTFLRAVDIEAVPVIVADSTMQARFVPLERDLHEIGHRPRTQAGRIQRARILKTLNELVFGIYGLDDGLVHRLSELHF